MYRLSRRTLIKLLGASAAAALWPLPGAAQSAPGELIRKRPQGGDEALTVIGLGTWRTFNVGSDPVLRRERARVLAAFFEAGGQLVDSSPMYGSSQAVLGYALDQLERPPQLYAADKVWTSDGDATREQIGESAKAWGIRRFDLMQVHNLLSWEAHLDTLEQMKADGEVRHIGITTSHGRRHREFEQIMRTRPLDFVQLTYNPLDREAEARLLPLAQEKGIGVIANRPFGGGGLINRLQSNGAPLPDWASEIGCHNWPQLLLKFIVSHPAVSCAIPATTRVEHLRENMGAARGELPDEALRRRLLDYLARL